MPLGTKLAIRLLLVAAQLCVYGEARTAIADVARDISLNAAEAK